MMARIKARVTAGSLAREVRLLGLLALPLATLAGRPAPAAAATTTPASSEPNRSAGPGFAPGAAGFRMPEAHDEGAELLDTRAPLWSGLEWIEGGPHTLAELRGKVVLLRFWSSGCPLCAETAPALSELADRWRERGLVVVAIHHPKSTASESLAVVRAEAERLGLDGVAIAQDRDWRTVRAYGIGRLFRRFTSASFLIDREGTIRFVHAGGAYHPGGGPGHEQCAADHAALEAAIARVLAGQAPAASAVRR